MRHAILLALLALLTAQAAQASFPYCKCIDYNGDSSPFRLVPSFPFLVPGAGGKLSANLLTISSPPATNPPSACYLSLQKDVKKIQISSSSACTTKGTSPNLKIYVNGKLCTTLCEVAPVKTPGTTGTYIKIKFVPPATESQLVGTTIQLMATGSCATPSALFGYPIPSGAQAFYKYSFFDLDSTTNAPCCPVNNNTVLNANPFPPPPPPPSYVPDYPHYCYPGNGGGKTKYTPYYLQWRSYVAKTRTVCIRVKKNTSCNNAKGCCSSDLNKVELVVKPACYRSFNWNGRINGKTITPSWTDDGKSLSGTTGYVLKWTNLGLNLATANNALICWELPKASTCNSPAKFFAHPAGAPFPNAILYAMFSSRSKVGTKTRECCGTNIIKS